MIPGELVTRRGRDRAQRRARDEQRCASSTPATGRSRSARTSTSPTSTTRSQFDRDAGHRLPARRSRGNVRALRARRRARRDAGRPRRRPPRARAADPPVSRIGRDRYGALYGPTVGDRLRLADTDLWLEVEEDRCVGGDEAVFGGGKTIRESMLQGTRTAAEGSPDLVITNVVVLDHTGVIRCDVGIRDGRIAALGKAGNPDIADGIDPDAGDRAEHRDRGRRGPDPDRRRDRLPRPLHLPADRRRGARGRRSRR